MLEAATICVALDVGMAHREVCGVEWTALPRPVPVSAEALEGDGMYLLDDGSCMWL